MVLQKLIILASVIADGSIVEGGPAHPVPDIKGGMEMAAQKPKI